jgi:hypothetical protein
MKIQKATKKGILLRFAFCGATGAGKTFSALRLATALGTPVCVIDTERGSASKYADQFDFFTIPLEDYSPEGYCEALRLCADEHVPVVVVDSLSHAWEAEGGILSIKDKETAAQRGGNDFAAWRQVTPRHNKLVNALLAYPGHLIVTMRSKMEYALEKTSSGKTIVQKIGMKPLQREGVEYEFDIVADMQSGRLDVTKTRCSALDGYSEFHPGRDLADRVKAWLGETPAVVPPPAEPSPPPPAEDLPRRVKAGLVALRALAPRKGLALDQVEAGYPKTGSPSEQLAWLRDKYREVDAMAVAPAAVEDFPPSEPSAIKPEVEPAPAPEPPPPAEPKKKRGGKAQAAADAAACAAGTYEGGRHPSEPPPWPELRAKAETEIRSLCQRMNRSADPYLAEIGVPSPEPGPEEQAVWRSAVTDLYKRLKNEVLTFEAMADDAAKHGTARW